MPHADNLTRCLSAISIGVYCTRYKCLTKSKANDAPESQNICASLYIRSNLTLKAITKNNIHPVCRDKRSNVNCKQNANDGHPAAASCRLPEPDYYSCLQSFLSRDGPAEAAAFETSKQSKQKARSGHEYIHRPRKRRLPGEQTFMKTFPQNHYNSITIPSSLYLRHYCCSANRPPQYIRNHTDHQLLEMAQVHCLYSSRSTDTRV